jgi:2-dehydro-3-deoxyphosphogluconate aldolase/(4S)-4-hydroxy-2-oxoglutarate aldolase
MTNYAELSQRLREAPFLPVIRTVSGEEALAAARTLIDVPGGSGISVIEITATIPDWPRVISRLRDELPAVTVGAGTVLDAGAVQTALEAGAEFIVSPGTFPAVTDAAEVASVPFIPGVLTPTELFSAPQHGLVKLFPASLGGIEYLRALLALQPQAAVIPTGGVTLAAAASWREAGALTVGVGVKSAEQASGMLQAAGTAR